MTSKKLFLELDMDGVLVDIHSYIENKLHQDGYTDFTFNNVKTYCMTGNIGVPRKEIIKYFGLPDVYLNADQTVNAIEFLNWVKGIPELDVSIHSLCYSEEIAKAKTQWLQSRISLGNISLDFQVGTENKLMFKSDIIVEDCLDNLESSSAPVKVLFSRPYNQVEHNEKFSTLFRQIKRIKDLSGLKPLILKELSEL